jgi:hypothetical protein
MYAELLELKSKVGLTLKLDQFYMSTDSSGAPTDPVNYRPNLLLLEYPDVRRYLLEGALNIHQVNNLSVDGLHALGSKSVRELINAGQIKAQEVLNLPWSLTDALGAKKEGALEAVIRFATPPEKAQITGVFGPAGAATAAQPASTGAAPGSRS